MARVLLTESAVLAVCRSTPPHVTSPHLTIAGSEPPVHAICGNCPSGRQHAGRAWGPPVLMDNRGGVVSEAFLQPAGHRGDHLQALGGSPVHPDCRRVVPARLRGDTRVRHRRSGRNAARGRRSAQPRDQHCAEGRRHAGGGSQTSVTTPPRARRNSSLPRSAGISSCSPAWYRKPGSRRNSRLPLKSSHTLRSTPPDETAEPAPS